jgi:hypothetical protein
MFLSSSSERRARLFDASSLELRPTEQLLLGILDIKHVVRVCPSRDDRLLVVCHSEGAEELLSIQRRVLELRSDLQEDDVLCVLCGPSAWEDRERHLQLHLLSRPSQGLPRYHTE